MNESYKIFISYSWHDKTIVDKIDKDFESLGISLIRDIRDLGNYTSIKVFMKQIKKSDFVILVVSYSYMISENCMYEILELLKSDNYKSQIIPIIIESQEFNIYSNQAIPKFINHWKEKYESLNNEITFLNREDCVEIDNKLRIISKIKSSIGEFITDLQDTKSPSLNDLIRTNYKAILDKINYKKYFNSDLFKECLNALYDDNDKKKAKIMSLDKPTEIGDWFLLKLAPPLEYQDTWYSRGNGMEGYLVLLAKIIKEMSEYTENSIRIRDKLINTIVNRPFMYDWEFNDWECELIRGLVEALLIIGDEASLSALYVRSISTFPDDSNGASSKCKEVLDRIGYTQK